MKIEDLTPYNYSGYIEEVKSIGWLEGDFPKGETDARLVEMLKTYPRKNLCRGFHGCEYCGEATGNGEIWTVSKDGQVYAAPSMLVHYIEAHNYLPPQEFIDSVLDGIGPDHELYESTIEEAFKNRTYKRRNESHEKLREIHEQRLVDELQKSVDKQIIEDIMKKK